MEVEMSIGLSSEVEDVDLGDKRLDRRLCKVIEELGESPSLSIPAATQGRAEMEAAYRLFDNPKVTPEKILQPHIEATRQRISQRDFVLLVQDTSELDLTRPNQQVEGAGPMDHDSRRGAFFHPLMAFDGGGIPLGLAWQKIWKRDSLNSHLSKKQRSTKRSHTPIEDKESIRWLEGIREAREVARRCPQTTCVCVGDSEADIYESFIEPRTFEKADGSKGELHLLIRARQRRATQECGDWFQLLRREPCLYRSSIEVSPRSPQKIAPARARKRNLPRTARIAELEVRTKRVVLRAPWRPDRQLRSTEINLVLIEEHNTPEGCEPICWLLATSLEIATTEEVKTIVNSYCLRWQIEIFFRTLKSGCRIQERYFEKLHRLLNCVAVYSIVAWRVMYLCRMGRKCPELSCEVIFEPCEWKAVYQIMKKKKPPKDPPPLNEIVRMVAVLGGFVDRRKLQPGTQTLWIGLQRLRDLTTAYKAFRS
jgi:hypothetical protein